MVCLNQIVLKTPSRLPTSVVLAGVFETAFKEGFHTPLAGAISANRANNPSAACLVWPTAIQPG